MQLTRLCILAPRAEAERIYGLVERAFEDDGLPVSIFETEAESELFEIAVYAGDDVEAVDARMREALREIGSLPPIRHEPVPDIDWVKHSLDGLEAVRAGRFLVHGAHQRARRRAGDIAVEIEAGLAFGTGHHGTTAGCLEMIADILKRERPANALDLGTGSAVLAIALAKLARIRVLASDIDPTAVQVARDNARLNGVAGLVETLAATGYSHPVFTARGPFDLVVANILAGPLMRLAPQVAGHLASSGSLVLSGILARQRRAVIAAYANQGLFHRRTLWREGWVTLHLKR